MSRHLFDKPLEVLTGLGFVRRIESVEDAYGFLIDWRGLRDCDKIHSIALKCVRAALDDEIEPETARSTVAAFARRAGIIAPEMSGPIAAAALDGNPGRSAH